MLISPVRNARVLLLVLVRVFAGLLALLPLVLLHLVMMRVCDGVSWCGGKTISFCAATTEGGEVYFLLLVLPLKRCLHALQSRPLPKASSALGCPGAGLLREELCAFVWCAALIYSPQAATCLAIDLVLLLQRGAAALALLFHHDAPGVVNTCG
jgi:hypothetical protein